MTNTIIFACLPHFSAGLEPDDLSQEDQIVYLLALEHHILALLVAVSGKEQHILPHEPTACVRFAIWKLYGYNITVANLFIRVFDCQSECHCSKTLLFSLVRLKSCISSWHWGRSHWDGASAVSCMRSSNLSSSSPPSSGQ